MTITPERCLAWLFANDMKESANHFMTDYYASEARTIDETDDWTNEQKLNTHRKTKLIYGGISLIGLVAIAVIQKTRP